MDSSKKLCYNQSMPNNEHLISHLKQIGVLLSSGIEKALRKADRRHFVPEALIPLAYEDHPLSIGGGQTISQPYTVVFMLELLHVLPGEKVLDIGSGSGWTTALLAFLTGPEGSVVGVERLDELVALGQRNLRAYDLPYASIRRAGSHIGLPGEHFDAILVSAAAEKLPERLLEQLNPGGRLVIPIKNAIHLIRKTPEGTFRAKAFPGFAFVPLITESEDHDQSFFGG